MKMMKNNKKGFTLVELLAVIVILALIMSVAVVSMGSVLETARKNTMKETAATIIDGVKKQLTLNNKLYNDATTGLDYGSGGAIFYFTHSLLDQGAVDSPMGGTFQIYDGTTTSKITSSTTTYPVSSIGGGALYYVKNQHPGSGTNKVKCSNANNQVSFVTVTKNATTGEYDYKICLTAGTGNYYIKDATYNQLLTSANDNTIIVQTA